MKTKIITALSLLSISCAQVPGNPPSLLDQMPEVLYVVPESSEKLALRPQWALFFSGPVDPASLSPQSILLSDETVETTSYTAQADLFKAIDRKSISSMALKYSLRNEGKMLILSADEDLEPQKTYTLIVTSRVLSSDRVPMKEKVASYQTGEAGLKPKFHEVFVDKSPVDPQAGPDMGNAGDAGSSTQPPETAQGGSPDSPLAPVPAPTPDNSTNPPQTQEPAPPEAPPQKAPTQVNPPQQTNPPQPARVVINEIYYDAVGSDTDGVLFVELFGTPGLKVGGYKIAFINGDDGKIYDSITLSPDALLRAGGFFLVADSRTGSASVSQVQGADLIDNFDPQNGPDAVQLLNQEGQLVDAVGYGDGIKPKAENGLASFEGRAAPDVINGHSLERKTPGADTQDNLNDFADREVPTPGR